MPISAAVKKLMAVVLLVAGVFVVQPSSAFATGSNPPAPTGLTMVSVGVDFVQFAWTAPASNGGSAITEYDVRYSSNNGISWDSSPAELAPALSTVVTGLSQGTTYRFEVAAVNGSGLDTGNGVGVGLWSAPLTAIPSTIPSPPAAPSAVLVHPTSVDLAWDAPGPGADGGQPITDYAIEAQSHRVADLDAGANHSCVVMDDGSVRCWGKNDQRQLGLGDTANRGDLAGQMGANLPAVDLGLGHTALEVTTGADHSCALLDDSSVRCWGDNTLGRLGVGDTTSTSGAVDLGPNRTATAISAGNGFTCAVLDNGTVKCWGVNNAGQLGQGDTALRGGSSASMGANLPAVDLGLGQTAVAVSAGDSHVCVLLSAPSNLYPVKCWGANANGQLGQESTENLGDGPGEMGDALLPVDLGTGLLATQVSAGGNSTCAVLSNGTTKCWGANGFAQLGLGDTTDRGTDPGQMGDVLLPVDLGTDGGGTPHYPIEVTNAIDHTCVRLEDGSVRCWGNNAAGQLGIGTTGGLVGDSLAQMGNNLPVIDLGLGRLSTDVETGTTHTCALLDDASVRCWGGNADGQLGLGNTTPMGGAAGQMGDNLPRTFTPTVVTADAGLPTGSTLTATIGGLEPGALQSIRIAATNGVGQSAWSPAMTVVPHGVPGSPTALSGAPASATSVRLDWTAPAFAGSPVTDYVVQYSTTGAAPWSTFVHGPSADTTATVTGLTQGQLTSFRVAAVNGDGLGDFSVSATATAATVPSAPLNLVTVPGHTSLSVGWDLPADGGAAIDDYVIEYRLHGDVAWTPYADGVSANNVAQINDLIADGNYDVHVAAHNVIGTGPFSAVATAQLVPGPPRAPANVHVTAKSGTSITIAWDPPADTGGSPITDYSVGYRLAAGGGNDTIDLHDTVTSYTIFGLDPGTAYVINVAASNDGGPGVGFTGFGPASDDLAVSTPTFPQAPTDLHSTNVTATSVALAWTAPVDAGGAPITKYVLQRRVTGTTAWAVVPKEPTTTTVTLLGLALGTSYDVQVQAVNIVSGGPFSQVLTVSTLDVPGTPTALQVTGRTGTSVSLAWTVPTTDGGAAISDYTVEYSSTGGAPFTAWSHTASPATSATVTGLVQGATYTFQVSAVNSVGTGSPSSTITGVPYTAAGKPGTPVTVPGNHSVAITWTAPADNGGSPITAYQVERSTNGIAWTTLTMSASASTRAYTALSLTNGTAYRFRVSAINAAGTGVASNASAAAVPRTVATAPGKPSVTSWNTQLSLSWTAPASNGGAAITAYTVQRSTNGITWTTVTATAPTTRTLVVSKLTNGVTYRFRVAAKNIAGLGPWSLAGSGAPTAVPGAPGKPSTAAGTGRVTLTWSAPATRGASAITAYRVQRSTDGITWTTVTSSAPLTRTFTVTGLVRAKAYRFRVAAINSLGAGAWSGIATATPR
jgi:alpha-tubulin suppressor-like RCC1 family protein